MAVLKKLGHHPDVIDYKCEVLRRILSVLVDLASGLGVVSRETKMNRISLAPAMADLFCIGYEENQDSISQKEEEDAAMMVRNRYIKG